MKARMKPEGKTEKILLVTGASSETGCALIRKCAGMYSRIWAHYGCSIEELNALQREWGDRIIPIQADFSREGSVEEMLAQIGDADAYPDHVVHLAAPKTCNMQFHKCHWEDYQKGVDISLRSAVLLLERLIPRMQKKRYGKIVFMLTSYVLGGVPPKYQSPYITVKYALYGKGDYRKCSIAGHDGNEISVRNTGSCHTSECGEESVGKKYSRGGRDTCYIVSFVRQRRSRDRTEYRRDGGMR